MVWLGVRASLVVLLLISAVIAGCADGEEIDLLPATVWGTAGDFSAEGVACGSCHYGMNEFWRTDVVAANGTWNVTVAPLYTDIPLGAVTVGLEDPVLARMEDTTFEWSQGSTWTAAIDVPEGAGAVMAKVYGVPAELDQQLAPLQMLPNDYVTDLRLVAPDGTATDATGPEDDLKMVVVEHPAPGSWTLEATLLGGDAQDARGVAMMEVLAGPVAGWMEGLDAAATWSFPMNETPPEVQVRLWPHKDHAPYEHSDWDVYDAVAHVSNYVPVANPEPPAEWTPDAIDAIWGEHTEHTFIDRTGSRVGAYLDMPGHNDPGIGSSYPNFGPLGAPVWPGTQEVEFRLEWQPAVPNEALAVRFSPANSPYFYEPDEVERGNGFATFRAPVSAVWWEDPAQEAPDHDHGHAGEGPSGYWDVAPFLRGGDGDPTIDAVTWSMQAIALREPASG